MRGRGILDRELRLKEALLVLGGEEPGAGATGASMAIVFALAVLVIATLAVLAGDEQWN